MTLSDHRAASYDTSMVVSGGVCRWRERTARTGHAPDYITSLLTPASDIPSRSSLRSLSNCDLVVPITSRETGDRAFSVATPRAWNRLPTDLKLLRSTASFKSKLKSFMFHAAYTHYVNSGMRHRSDCRRRTTSHCCYCYCYCHLNVIFLNTMYSAYMTKNVKNGLWVIRSAKTITKQTEAILYRVYRTL